MVLELGLELGNTKVESIEKLVMQIVVCVDDCFALVILIISGGHWTTDSGHTNKYNILQQKVRKRTCIIVVDGSPSELSGKIALPFQVLNAEKGRCPTCKKK